MAQYLVYGRILDSTLPLSLPPPASEKFQAGLPAACFVFSQHDASCDSGEVKWYHHHSSPYGTEPWLSLGRRDGYHVFRFGDGHCFLLYEDRDQIDVCLCGADSSSLEIESLLLNHVLPLALAHRGSTAIHASALEFPQGAALFIGESGAGKSTLARHLAASGFRLLTDDCAMLETAGDPPLVFAGYPAIRVIDDSLVTANRFRGKAFLSPIEFPFLFRTEPSPVAAVFQLEPKPAGPIEIIPLSVRDAQFALTRHAFRLDPGDRQRLQEEFKVNSDLAQRLPTFSLSYPHDANLLPEVRELLQSHLESLGDSDPVKSTPFRDHDVRPA